MKRKLLDNGNIWQKSDGRWIGMVRYKDEYGVTQRKSFSSKKKKTLQAKMTEYVKSFNEQVANSDESRKPLKESMKNWLRVYKYPEVERTTYDRYECTAEHQIYPYIGNKPVGDITPADIKMLLTMHMNAGYAFTTSKKAYSLLKMFFKQLFQEGSIPNNPMVMIDMTKKDNYLASQNKESKPQCDLVVVFTDEELEQIKAEAFKRFANGKPVYQQSAAYFLMLNTGLRAGELCGIINSDIDLKNRVIHLQRGVKEVHVRDGLEYVPKLEVKVGKLKSKTSNRFYRILDAIGLPHKGLHTFRHTFATRLINGVKQPDGSVKALSVKQVAELLGHTTSEITEIYYVKRDTSRLAGLTDGFNL